MKKAIVNGKVILKDTVQETNVLIEDDRIVGLSDSVPDGYGIIDAKGLYISPGFVDIHTHGRNLCDTMNGTPESIDTISVNCLKTGVTSFLPTTMTQSIDQTHQAIVNCAKYMGHENGAKVAGVHMEGPFIDQAHKGAQPGQYVLAPSIEAYQEMVGEHGKVIRLITIAPEQPGAEKLIHYLKAQGVTVSIGHTGATYEQAKTAFMTGVNHATHTYNAMTAFTHRAPGVVGAVFDSDEVYAELILDGFHVHWAAAKILIREKGVEKVCLITDSMEASGVSDGTYQLGGQEVFVKNGQARLEDGTIAGSVLKLNVAVYNACHYLHMPIYEAVRMASYNPARSCHLMQIGQIAPYKKADLIMFDDKIDIKWAMLDGKEKSLA